MFRIRADGYWAQLTGRTDPANTTRRMDQSAIAGLRVAVIGASLGGLSAASVLKHLKADVHVFEAFEGSFASRGGGLGGVGGAAGGGAGGTGAAIQQTTRYS